MRISWWWVKEGLALTPMMILVLFWCLVLLVMAGLVVVGLVGLL